MQNTSMFNSLAGVPLVPSLPLFQLPVVNHSWLELYNPSQSHTLSQHPVTNQKKRGFTIADILSEEQPSEHELAMKRLANHPYYPAVRNHLAHGLAERGAVMRQCRNKRVRTIFTPEQLEELEKIFEKQQYMVGTERYYLATKLRLSEAQVKVWFQNRRIKWRKQSGLEGVQVGDGEDFSPHANNRYEYSDTCSESGFSDTGSL